MKRLMFSGAAAMLAVTLGFASPKASSQTFVGSIGDSACGLKHMMGGGDKECTEECVKAGATYILADATHNKVYNLNDQKKAAAFSGEKVKVMGTLNGDTIQVTSIAAEK